MDCGLHSGRSNGGIEIWLVPALVFCTGCLSSPTKLIPADPGQTDVADAVPDLPDPAPDTTPPLDQPPQPDIPADPGEPDPGIPDPAGPDETDVPDVAVPDEIALPDPSGPDEATDPDDGPPDEDIAPDLTPDPGIDLGPPPASLKWDLVAVPFAETWVFADGGTRELTLKNDGGTKSSTIAVTLDNLDDYVLVDDDCSDSVLYPGSTCMVKVGFKPMKKGQRTGTLAAVADPGGTASAGLAGSGKSVLELNKDSIGWPAGSVNIGEVVEGQFFLQNAGDLTTGSLVLRVIPPGPPFEALMNTCSETVNPFGSCHPHVRFYSDLPGKFEAIFHVSADPGGGDEVKFSFEALK